MKKFATKEAPWNYRKDLRGSIVFNKSEKSTLVELPAQRYQIMDISTRKVSRLAHKQIYDVL